MEKILVKAENADLNPCNKHLDKLKFWKQIDPNCTTITNLLDNTLHGLALVCS